MTKNIPLTLSLAAFLLFSGAQVSEAQVCAAGSARPLNVNAGTVVLASTGAPFRIAGVNWFGMETGTSVVHGLWIRDWKEMMREIKSLGYNTIRLPYSNEALMLGRATNSINCGLITPNGERSNAELCGLSPLQVLDKLVVYAGQIGLRIILDHHRTLAGDSANDNGLWYYPGAGDLGTEARWVSDWVMLANRYKNCFSVIGADLHNEPHTRTPTNAACWGTAAAGCPNGRNWRRAARVAGNAVLQAAPRWLIFVEGIQRSAYRPNPRWGANYWWGGNLLDVRNTTLELTFADGRSATASRLVYSVHDYPGTVGEGQPWFDDPRYPAILAEPGGVWDTYWGFLIKELGYPVYLGEFGSKLIEPKDKQWMSRLINAYVTPMGARLSWTIWSWNPNSRDSGGLLGGCRADEQNWEDLHNTKHNRLVRAQDPPRPITLPQCPGANESD